MEAFIYALETLLVLLGLYLVVHGIVLFFGNRKMWKDDAKIQLYEKAKGEAAKRAEASNVFKMGERERKLIGWDKCFLRSISKEYDKRFISRGFIPWEPPKREFDETSQ